MTNDGDRLVLRGLLEHGPERLPDRVLQQVLDTIPTIPQRHGMRPPWLSMGRGTLALATTAAAAVALLALLLFATGLPAALGPGPSAVSPSGTTMPSASPSEGATDPLPSTKSTGVPTLGPGTVLTDVLSFDYPQSVLVGERFAVTLTIRNRGDATSDPIVLAFGDLSTYARVDTCSPACVTTLSFGDIRATFAVGVQGGETATFTVGFITIAAGDVSWTMNVERGTERGYLALGHTEITRAETPGPSAGQRSLTPTIAAAPANDSPPGKAITNLPFIDTEDVTLAGIYAMELASPCGGGSKSVWYTYTATAAATLVADTGGSDYDTILDIWRGSITEEELRYGDGTMPTLQLHACNDDTADSAQAAVVWAVEPGVTYTIRISAKNGWGGHLTFRVSPAE